MMRVYCDEVMDDVEHEAADGDVGAVAAAAELSTGATAAVCFFSVVIKEAELYIEIVARERGWMLDGYIYIYIYIYIPNEQICN